MQVIAIDPNMATASRWADELGPPPASLPSSLEDVSKRANLVNEINRADFADALLADYRQNLDMKDKQKQLDRIGRISKQYMPDVKSSEERQNISLRLWSGCLAAAKTIAPGTISGPNTPTIRGFNVQNIIDPQSQSDPIFRAGVEVGISFKKLLKEPYSLEGIPDGSPVLRFP